MSTNYLPSREAELITWSNNFTELLIGDPDAYGITTEQATAYAALHAAFVTDYQRANDPATNSHANTVLKNTSKKALITSTRALARQIQGAPTVTDFQRAELGLTVRDTDPTPVPVPTTRPVLDVTSKAGHTIAIRLHDAANPTRRGKPAGVTGATVLSFVGSTPPADISDWKFEGSITRTTFDVRFPVSVPPSSPVWLTAFWFNSRAQAGPACEPVQSVLASSLPMTA